MRRERLSAFFAFQAVLIALALAALACTANDTLFIRLTETPTPTISPTPLGVATKFKIDQSGVLVSISEFTTIALPPLPGPFRAGMPNTANCFPNTRVKISDISLNRDDPNDKIIYYQISCAGRRGWAPEYTLSRFGKSDEAAVKTPDGKGATLYSNADQTSPEAGICAEGTQVNVLSVTHNPFNNNDQEIYVQISCNGGVTGYVSENMLVPIS